MKSTVKKRNSNKDIDIMTFGKYPEANQNMGMEDEEEFDDN